MRLIKKILKNIKYYLKKKVEHISKQTAPQVEVYIRKLN